jgi:hypothetical protein
VCATEPLNLCKYSRISSKYVAARPVTSRKRVVVDCGAGGGNGGGYGGLFAGGGGNGDGVTNSINYDVGTHFEPYPFASESSQLYPSRYPSAKYVYLPVPPSHTCS